jgi:hypothetical protein
VAVLDDLPPAPISLADEERIIEPGHGVSAGKPEILGPDLGSAIYAVA